MQISQEYLTVANFFVWLVCIKVELHFKLVLQDVFKEKWVHFVEERELRVVLRLLALSQLSYNGTVVEVIDGSHGHGLALVVLLSQVGFEHLRVEVSILDL